MRKYAPTGLGPAGILLLALFALSGATVAQAGDCPALLPADAVAIAQPRLCHSRHVAGNTHFSCQDYHSTQGRFRVLFKGGQVPRAVLRIDRQGEELVWTRSTVGEPSTCALAPPEGIPANAIHRGTGVCFDDDNQAVPCSMFEHASPRQKDMHRYMVFYFPAQHGGMVVEKFHAGRNENAVVAELSYQLGLSLLNTRCCSRQAIAYLEYAYRLFPRADLYSSAYEEARFLLAARANPTDFALYLD